jgi:hypothetical protein
LDGRIRLGRRTRAFDAGGQAAQDQVETELEPLDAVGIHQVAHLGDEGGEAVSGQGRNSVIFSLRNLFLYYYGSGVALLRLAVAAIGTLFFGLLKQGWSFEDTMRLTIWAEVGLLAVAFLLPLRARPDEEVPEQEPVDGPTH